MFIFGCAGSSLLRWLSSSCSEWGYFLVGVLRLLPVADPLVAEHRL